MGAGVTHGLGEAWFFLPLSLSHPSTSPDDSDYDEVPEEGPRAPAAVMTKKVGQAVVRVWAVCLSAWRVGHPLPFRPWGLPDREWAADSLESSLPLLCPAVQGSGASGLWLQI